METWKVMRNVPEKKDGVILYSFTATTPEGPDTWSYHVGDSQVGEVEPVVKGHAHLDLFTKYFLEPDTLNQDRLVSMIHAVGDRAFFAPQFLGV